MQTLLVVAVVFITLAVITEAGALVAMYLMSRRIGLQVETLLDDGRKLKAPLETITSNLKTATNDLTETGKIARAQALQVQDFLTETQQNVRAQVADIRTAAVDTVDEARRVIMRPIRLYSAVAMGIAVGVRTFFRGKQTTKQPSSSLKSRTPAA